MTDDRWVSKEHWRRPSQQTRSEKTQTGLLDATEALIIEKGTEATSIADIAKRAGCSVGTVYHHFKDKKALFYALFHRMTQAYSDKTKEASDPAIWTGASVRDLIKGYIEITLEMKVAAGKSKAAVALVIADHPELRAHVAELQADGRRALAALILERRQQIGHEDPDHAVAFFVDQLGAMLNARNDPAQNLATIDRSDDTAFTTQILEFASGYLTLGA